MAQSAVIGALRVDLGINTAQFTAGLAKSQASLAKFGKMAAVGFAAVTTAAIAAGAAMGVAVKGAIDSADAMSKAAQKVGVTTEALSRLSYAADFSGVSFEQLTGGMTKLSKTMADVAGGSTGPAATAFKALGVSITDASGKLRSSDAVFADVAAAFAQLEDGSTKTAISLSLFGKSGAELIPLLNSGRDGLNAYAAESDKLGATISTKTGKAAEVFNDTMTRLGKVMQGVVNKVTEAALPALQSFADFLASPQFAEAAQAFGSALITTMSAVAQAIAGITLAAKDLFTFLNANAGNGYEGLSNADLERQIANAKRIIKRRKADGADLGNLEQTLADQQAALANRKYRDTVGGGATFGQLGGFLQSGKMPEMPVFNFGALTNSAETAGASVTDLMAGIIDAQPKVENFAQTIGDSLAGAFSGFADAVMSGVPAVEALSDVLGNLGKQLLNSAITSFFGNLFGGGSGVTGLLNITGGLGSTKGGSLVRSFDGGGYTGMGSRSGGIDGIGGFPAILHPNETVIDHAAGQSMGGGHIAVSVSVGVQNGNLVPLIAQVSGEVAGRKIKQEAPAAVMAYQRNGGA